MTPELQEIRQDIREIRNQIDQLKDQSHLAHLEIVDQLSALRVKSGMWGALGGLFPVLLALTIAMASGLAQ